MSKNTSQSRRAIKALKRPFKRFAYLVKHGLATAMSGTGEWLIFTAQRFSPYRFRGYQPMPWIGLNTRKRDESTRMRWQTITENLDIEQGTALDIGSNLGYFVLKFAEKGFFAIGVDMAYGNIQVARYVQHKAGIQNAAFSVMDITPDNVHVLPAVDVLVFFSVWHHWIVAYGPVRASTMLSTVWEKTRHVMFFETGEDVEIKRLKVTGNTADWVRSQLEQACPGATIKVIGTFDRGTHQKIKKSRTVFALYRQ